MIDTQTKTEQAQGVQSVAITCEEFRNSVDSSYPSIFTKDDVKKLIDEIEEKLVSKLNEQSLTQQSASNIDLDNLKQKLKDTLEGIIDSHDYDDNAEFELSGRSVILDFTSRYLNDEVMEGIDEVWDEIFPTKEDEN